VPETKPSICRLCINGCPILVEVADGRVTRVTGDRSNDSYDGYTCVKGRAQPRFLAHPDRLLHSLKRGADGCFAAIPTEQAFDEIAERLGDILDRHGPRAVACYWGTMIGASGTVVPVIDAFLRAIGSPMEFSAITIDKPGKNVARALHGSWMAPRQGFDDPEVALLIGINPLVSYQGVPNGNPGKWLPDALRRGMALLVVDPRRSDVARRATVHLQCRPGEDAAILAGMLHVILEEGRHDRAFVDEHVTGLEALRRAVQPFTPAAVAARADVDVDDLVRAARIFGDARRGYATPGTGPSMSGPGTLVEYLTLCLETVCGHYLRAGERVRNPGVLMPTFSAKAQASPPTQAYGYGEQMRVRGLARSAAGLPTAALADEILLEGEGQVRALISCGGNPATAWPDQGKTLAALRALDLLVQVDPWMSQTAQLAHYVIAPKLPLELPGSSLGRDFQSLGAPAYGSIEPFGQYTPAIVEPPAGSDLIDDWELFYEVGRRLGVELEVTSYIGKPIAPTRLDPDVKPTTDQLLEAFTRGSRIPLEEVKRHPHGAVFEDPPVHVAAKDPDCDARLDVGNGDMMRDLERVAAGLGQEERPRAGADEPGFRLLCRRSTHVYNSSCNDESTNRGRPYNPAFLHPDDLARLGVRPGELVELSTAGGTAVAVAQPDAGLRTGMVSMSVGFGDPREDDDVLRSGTSVNRLLTVDQEFDRYTGQPLMSNVPVDVRPLTEARAGTLTATAKEVHVDG